MQCPKCEAAMEDVSINKMFVKRCTSCQGLWFDRSKHEYLRKQPGSESIDTGDEEVGREFDSKDDIFCPSCSAPMIKMVVADQPHIHYESCSKCFSVFFDAGEFRDYINKDIFDFFRDLMVRERN